MNAPVLRERVATSLVFLTSGFLLGAWTAQIPAVKHHLGLSDGALGLGLLMFAAGAIAGMQVIGPIVDRYGAARVLVPMLFLNTAALLTPAVAPNLIALAGALFLFGLVQNTVNIAMNARAVAVEQAWGRSIMSSFHAMYSIGGLTGAILSGALGFGPLGTLAVVALIGATLSLVAMPGLPVRAVLVSTVDSHADGGPQDGGPGGGGPGDGGPGDGGPLRGVLLLGAIAYCCLVGEGAAADWSAVYLRDNLGTTAGYAAAAYAAFALMMTAGRLVGDRLVRRFGPVRLVRASAILAGAGLTAGLLGQRPVAGVLGFACLGAGLSCIAPLTFSAAGRRRPAQAGRAIARVASIGYLGFLTGPLVIGATAELTGLPVALAIPALLAGFVAFRAPALSP